MDMEDFSYACKLISAIILGIGLIILLCVILSSVGNVKHNSSLLSITKEDEKEFEELVCNEITRIYRTKRFEENDCSYRYYRKIIGDIDV